MALQEVGVEAVVRGLSAFQSDIGRMNSSLQNLRGEGTFLQQAFGAITDGIIGFGEHIVRVAETALGVLLRDAIRAVIDSIKEMISATFEAGAEFQTLELRLERLNFNDLVESGENYTAAGREAVEMTKEQLEWLQKLAAQTPYDSTDVANVFTLARSYGFAADEAMGLTEDILNFAAGMGLGNQEIERIIINFGQMIQQQKLNSQDLRDLARGAFVPVNDILKIMMKDMTEAGTITADFSAEIEKESEKLRNLENDLAVALLKQEEFTDTTKESTKLANAIRIEDLRKKIGEAEEIIRGYQESTGKAVEITVDNFDELKKELKGEAVTMFIKAFSELVGTRFSGAAEKMAVTFKAATDNVKDLVKGIFGLNTVKPILDVLGERVAGFAEAFTQDPRAWDQLVAAASRLGAALSSVVAGILDLLPGTENITETVISLIERAAQWVEDNRENIIGFFRGIGETIQNDVVPWIRDNLIPAIIAFFAWVNEHKGEILQFFGDLATTIIEDVIPFVRDYLIPAFQKFSDWVLENKDLILSLFDQLGDAVLKLAAIFLPKLEAAMQWIEDNPEKVQGMIDVWGKWQVVGTILDTVGGIILSITGFMLGLSAAVSGAAGVFQFIGAIISTIFLRVLGALILQIQMVRTYIELFRNSLDLWKFTFDRIGLEVETFIERIKDAFASGDWGEIGMAIIQGIADGMQAGHEIFMHAIENVLGDLWDAVQTFLGMGSPSKLFMGAGISTMQGLALGIQKSAGLAAMTMQGAMARVSSAAVPSVTNSTVYNSTANYNLNINSGAQTEPIVQDFAMMQSLAGV